MIPERRSIFRNEALEHHLRAKENAVFPRFVSPRTAVYGWLVLVLVIGAIVALSFLPPLVRAFGGT